MPLQELEIVGRRICYEHVTRVTDGCRRSLYLRLIKATKNGDPTMTSPSVMWQATAPKSRAMTREEKMGAPSYAVRPTALWAVALVAGLVALVQGAPIA